MSTKTTIIVFLSIFAVAAVLIVGLPFLLKKERGPSPSPQPNQRHPQGPTDQGFFRSDDGGETWQQRVWVEGGGSTIAAHRINRIIVDPVRPERLFLATADSGLWVSVNRGDLWARVEAEGGVLLGPATHVLALAVNRSDPREWYVATFRDRRGRLLRSGDDGKTFQEVYVTPVERFGVFDVYHDAATGHVDIMTGQGGLLRSTTPGSSWRVIRWFADGLTRLLVNPVNPAVRFVITPKGSIFRTVDRGVTWVDATPALQSFAGAQQNQRWFMDHAGVLYVGSNYGLLRSRDNGATFEAPQLIIPPEALPVLAGAVDPRDSRRIIVAVQDQLYESKDDGESWTIVPTPSQKRITELLIDREDSNVIYAVVQP